MCFITCAKLRHFVTMHYSHKRSGSYWKFVGKARLDLCCLDGERVVGNDDNSVFVSSDRYLNWKRTTKLLCQYFH